MSDAETPALPTPEIKPWSDDIRKLYDRAADGVYADDRQTSAECAGALKALGELAELANRRDGVSGNRPAEPAVLKYGIAGYKVRGADVTLCGKESGVPLVRFHDGRYGETAVKVPPEELQEIRYPIGGGMRDLSSGNRPASPREWLPHDRALQRLADTCFKLLGTESHEEVAAWIEQARALAHDQGESIKELENELHDVLDSKDASLESRVCTICGGGASHATYCVVRLPNHE